MRNHEPKHAKQADPLEDTLGQALCRTLKRYGIHGYIVGINGDGDTISIDTVIEDENGTPLIDDEAGDQLATVTWTAKLRDGGGPKR